MVGMHVMLTVGTSVKPAVKSLGLLSLALVPH